MKFYPNRTVEQQAERLPSNWREAYRNSQIDRIKLISGSVSIDVTGYSEYSYLEEKSYATQPVRTVEGKIEEIEEYDTFLTPRLIIKYNMMNIDDYRAIMKMLKSKNVFWVQLYDVVEDQIVIKEMYAAPTSMPMIYQQYLVAMGIQEFSIELIGTNNEESTFFIGNNGYSAAVGTKWADIVGTGKLLYHLTVGTDGVVRYNDLDAEPIMDADKNIVYGEDYVMPSHKYSLGGYEA